MSCPDRAAGGRSRSRPRGRPSATHRSSRSDPAPAASAPRPPAPPPAPGPRARCARRSPPRSSGDRPVELRAAVDAGHLDPVDPDPVDRLALLQVLLQARAPAAELDPATVEHQVVGVARRPLAQRLAVAAAL